MIKVVGEEMWAFGLVTSLLLNCAFIHRFLILTFLKSD